VGGTICLAQAMHNPFPDEAALAYALRQWNPHLSGVAARESTAEIIWAKDSSDCEYAWQLADQAIKAGETPE